MAHPLSCGLNLESSRQNEMTYNYIWITYIITIMIRNGQEYILGI